MTRPRLFLSRAASVPSVSAKVPTTSHFCLNVNGFNSEKKRSQLISMRLHYNWKVLYITDTRIHDEALMLKVKSEFKATEVFWSPGTTHVGGTAILFFCPVTIIKSFLDPRGRYTRVDYV
jgi:hypothetical protein